MRILIVSRIFNVALDAIVRMSRTRLNYWLEFVLDGVLGVSLLIAGTRRHIPPFDAVLLICLGLFIFSFIEYSFHRWLFHGPFRVMAQGHTSHHDNPQGYDSLPFFLPALILLGLSALCVLLMPVDGALLLSSGIAFGYVSYGLNHFLIHHFRFRHFIIRKWAAYHHIHHFHPNRNYGVTTPLWDILLGTRYVSTQNIKRLRTSFSP
jgi:sterol desaturase/sphingolipid hydroxylase (fatty acid hydroxylase superfamily)